MKMLWHCTHVALHLVGNNQQQRNKIITMQLYTEKLHGEVLFELEFERIHRSFPGRQRVDEDIPNRGKSHVLRHREE